MRVDHDVFAGAVKDQSFKDFVDISPFVRSRVKFAVAVGTRATFAKTIIAFRVDLVFFMDGREITTTCSHIFTPFNHNGFDA